MIQVEDLCIQVIDNKELIQYFLRILHEDIENASLEDRFITIDTEFIREKLEQPLLCLLQISSPKYNFIIDPLSINLSFLDDILSSKDILKVFHCAAQDIEMLALHKLNIVNLYDSQLYEMILDTKELVSYQYIVNKYLGKKLKKNHSISNWSKRPLSEKQIQYSIEDVFYLRETYKKQKQELSRANRLGWLDKEINDIIVKNSSKIGKNNSINNEENIYLQLTQWIEDYSIKNNINPESIIKNKLIKTISTKGKNFINKMKNSRYIDNEHIIKFLDFAGLVTENLKITKKKFKKNSIFFALKSILELASTENNIAASMIATSDDLEKIVCGSMDSICFSGWRKNIFGDHVISFLNGELSISMHNFTLTLHKIKA